MDDGYDPRDVQTATPKLVALATPKGTVTDSGTSLPLSLSSPSLLYIYLPTHLLRLYIIDWARLLPQITRTLAAAKSQRLERERAALIHSRSAAIADLYSSVAKEFPAEEWKALPGAEYVMGVKVFRELINDKYVGGDGDDGLNGGINVALDLNGHKFVHLKLREKMKAEIEGWGMRRRQRVLKVVHAAIAAEEEVRQTKKDEELKEREKENREVRTAADEAAETQKTANSVPTLKLKDTSPRAEMQLEHLDLATMVLETPLSWSSPSSPSAPPLSIARLASSSRSTAVPILRASPSSRSAPLSAPSPKSRPRKVYVSWSDIIPILRRNGDVILRGGLQWSERGSMAVKTIIRLLAQNGESGEMALKVETARTGDLDRADARIVCMECAEENRAAMTWRECVSLAFFLRDTPLLHSLTSFRSIISSKPRATRTPTSASFPRQIPPPSSSVRTPLRWRRLSSGFATAVRISSRTSCTRT